MTADEIITLVDAAFGDDIPYQLDGGDAVGTDAYPALRDAHATLVEAMASPAAEVRIFAAYALSLIVEEPLARIAQPVLDAACTAAELPLEQAAMILASNRLATTPHLRRGPEPSFPFDGLGLTREAARATTPILRVAYTIAQLWRYPRFYRRVTRDVDALLEAFVDDDKDVAPWYLASLADYMRDTLTVIGAPAAEPSELDEPPAPTIVDSDHLDRTPSREPIAELDVADPYMQERPVRESPRVLLAGLHDVPWADLEHAYGSAEGVPHMIEALTSRDRGDRAWGLDALFASINHQGSVYEASAPAVRFLVELALRGDVDDRASILRLIAGIAVHDPAWQLVRDLARAASPAWPEVVACAGSIMTLLRDREDDVRSTAAMVLSFVDPPAGLIDELVTALAGETNRYVRASLLLAIGYACRRRGYAGDIERAAVTRYLNDDCMLIVACAAIGLAQIDRESCGAPIRDVLARTILDAPRVVGPWPWNGGDIAGFARIVRIMISTTDDLLAEADSARARDDVASALDYATKAFTREFRDGSHGSERRWRRAELDERRRRILRFLVAIAPTEQVPLDVMECDAAGIPTSLGSVRRLVGDDHGPADAIIDVLDAVLYGLEPPAALDATFAAIAPEQHAAVIDDLLRGPYRPWHRRGPHDFASAASYARDNDFTSAFILALAPHVGELAARGIADEQLAAHASGRRDALRSTLCAVVLARAAVAAGHDVPDELDALVALDQAPVSTYRLALRQVYAVLPAARRLRLLDDAPLYTYTAFRDPRGEVRRWHNGRGWDVVDLLAPAEIVAKITAAQREWERHRSAGDDPHAEPVSGSRTTSLDSKPPPDEEFPHARASSLLEAAALR